MSSRDANRCSQGLRQLVAILVAAFGLALPAFAAQVTLAWNASTNSSVTGYYVYVGTAPGSYPSRINAGNATSATVTSLTPGATYYFAVTAYSATAESGYSNEVQAVVGAVSTTAVTSTPNPSIVNTSVTMTATVSGAAPTGTVAFRNGGVTMAGCGSVALVGTGNARTATCNIASLPAGLHSITAHYAGNTNNAASSSAVHPQYVQTAAGASTFADVTPDHWTFEAIEALAYHGITNGCSGSPRLFCPDRLVERDEMAVFLERAMRGPAFVYSPTGTRFADVPIGHWAVGPIEQLWLDGVTSGCTVSPLSFCPDLFVNRAAMTKFLLKARFGAAYSPPAATGAIFVDVPRTHAFAAWIEDLHRLGYTQGCGAASFCPDGPVSRAAMAVFLQRVFELAPPP